MQIDYDLLLPVLIGTAYSRMKGFSQHTSWEGWTWMLGCTERSLTGLHIRLPSDRWRPSCLDLLFPQWDLSPGSSHIQWENVRDPWLIQTMMDDLASFARALTTQWRQIRLSEIDPAGGVYSPCRRSPEQDASTPLEIAQGSIVLDYHHITGRLQPDSERQCASWGCRRTYKLRRRRFTLYATCTLSHLVSAPHHSLNIPSSI